MGLFGTLFGDSGSAVVAPSYSGAATTAHALRDQIIALIDALVPIATPNAGGNRFAHYRNEGDGDFMEWAGTFPNASFRRFQVRDIGRDQPPDISNGDVEARYVTFRVLVAYPQGSRTGPLNTLSRDDMMSSDQHQIEHTIGLAGYGNFPTASWVSGSTDRVTHGSVDFLSITQTMRFYRRFP